MATDGDLRRLVRHGLAGLGRDRDRLDRVHSYLHGRHAGPYMPPSANREYRLLAARALANFLPLVVKSPAQAMRVSGYDHSGAKSTDIAPEWRAWQANRMDSRQHAVHAAAIAYGHAYVRVLPEDGRPVIRGVSPRQMYAAYDDPANDALPLWAMQIERFPSQVDPDDTIRAWLITKTHVIEFRVCGGPDGGTEPVASVPHGMTLDGEPVCPVVRFAPGLDLEGRAVGVVEPLIPIQDRINQTIFDLLVAQTFGSFKVRTISGMAPQIVTDRDGNPVLDPDTGKPKVQPIRADASRFLVAPDPDTRFGQLDETPLGGFLDAIEAAVRQMSVIGQTPPHYLLGSVVNLSAEALAAAEAALTRAVRIYQAECGESWELVMALAGSILGEPYDRDAQMVWDDHESRSLAQTIDALGKAVQMLHVPPREVWRKIPGVTAGDVERWIAAADADDQDLRLSARLRQVIGDEGSGVAD